GIETLLSNDKRVFASREKLMKNAELTKFLIGMRSAFDLLPEHTNHNPNFIDRKEVKIYNFNAERDLSKSWEVIASVQECTFKKLINKADHHQVNIKYEPTCY
ncbi:hypothetical protein WAJ43_20870, partial [Acinetobacter baumannii]